MKRALLCILFAAACSSYADDINLQIQGSVYATTCSVSNDTKNKVVDMGAAPVSDYAASGASGPWVDFQLSLSDCPASIRMVGAKFDGEKAALTASLFANQGTGTGIGLELRKDDQGATIMPGSQEYYVPDQQNNVVIPLTARYVRTQEALNPGTFQSIIQLTFTYR